MFTLEKYRLKSQEIWSVGRPFSGWRNDVKGIKSSVISTGLTICHTYRSSWARRYPQVSDSVVLLNNPGPRQDTWADTPQMGLSKEMHVQICSTNCILVKLWVLILIFSKKNLETIISCSLKTPTFRMLRSKANNPKVLLNMDVIKWKRGNHMKTLPPPLVGKRCSFEVL